MQSNRRVPIKVLYYRSRGFYRVVISERVAIEIISQCVKKEQTPFVNIADCRPQLKDTRTPTNCSTPLNSPQPLPQFLDTQSAESRDHLPQPVLSQRLRITRHHNHEQSTSRCQHLRIPPATRPQIFPIATTKYEDCRRALPLPRSVRSIQLKEPRKTRKHCPPPIFLANTSDRLIMMSEEWALDP